MPINIPNNLPAWNTLEQENIFIMSEKRASSQDIRPLRILILNLMPKKIDTERQLLRMLSNTPLQVDIELMQTATHNPKNTPQDHLLKFYKTFSDIKDQYFDGMIITGAPVEHLEFEEVAYSQNFVRLWNGANITFTPPCISAGVHRQLFTIITGCGKHFSPKRCSVFSRTPCTIKRFPFLEALMRFTGCLIPATLK